MIEFSQNILNNSPILICIFVIILTFLFVYITLSFGTKQSSFDEIKALQKDLSDSKNINMLSKSPKSKQLKKPSISKVVHFDEEVKSAVSTNSENLNDVKIQDRQNSMENNFELDNKEKTANFENFILSYPKLEGIKLFEKFIKAHHINLQDFENIFCDLEKLPHNEHLMINTNKQMKIVRRDMEGLKMAKYEHDKKFSNIEKILQNNCSSSLQLVQEFKLFQNQLKDMVKPLSQEKKSSELLKPETMDRELGLVVEQCVKQKELAIRKDWEIKRLQLEEKQNQTTKQLDMLLNQNKALEQEKMGLQMELYEASMKIKDMNHQMEIVKLQQRTQLIQSSNPMQNGNPHIMNDENFENTEAKHFEEIMIMLKAIKSNLYLRNNSETKYISHQNNQSALAVKEFRDEISRTQTYTVAQIESLNKNLIQHFNRLKEELAVCSSQEQQSTFMSQQRSSEIQDLKQWLGKTYSTLMGNVKSSLDDKKEDFEGYKTVILDGVKVAIEQALPHVASTFYELLQKKTLLENESKDAMIVDQTNKIYIMLGEIKDLCMTLSHSPIKVHENHLPLDEAAIQENSSKTNISSPQQSREINELRGKNNDLRETNWNLMERIIELENKLGNYVIKEARFKDMKNNACEFMGFISRIIFGETDQSSPNFSNILQDSTQMKMYCTKIKQVMVEHQNENKFLAKQVEELRASKNGLENNLSDTHVKRVNQKFPKNYNLIPSDSSIEEQNKLMLGENEILTLDNRKLMRQCILLENFYNNMGKEVIRALTQLKGNVLQLQKEENIKLQKDCALNKGKVNNKKQLTFSKPFYVEIMEKHKTLNSSDNQVSADDENFVENKHCPILVTEPWIEVSLQPYADPDLLKELESYKTKLQDLQRELINLQGTY